MLGNPFYHGHIRKFIAAFGGLFDDIKIATVDGSGMIVNASTVPLRYASQDKTTINDNLDNIPYNEIYPRMSFELTQISYDAERKTNPLNKINGIMAPTPYIMDMSLNILSRNFGDALQIIEQIIPWFNPTLTITMENSPMKGVSSDIPITLTAINIDDDYMGDEDKQRRVEINISFQAIVDFYRNVGSGYENALTAFIIKNHDPDDPTTCTPPRNRHFHPQKNRIEKITMNYYTNKEDFCKLFDNDPTNDFGIDPDEVVIVQATQEEIEEYDRTHPAS